MGYQYPYPKRWQENIMVVLHIYGDKSISYYFLMSKTLKTSHKNWKLVYLDQYKPFLNIQCSLGQRYLYSTMWEEMCCIYSYLWSKSHFLPYFDNQDTESYSPEKEICIGRPILSNIKTSKSLFDNDIHTLYESRKCL